MITLLEEETWLSLEENMFGFKWKWREKSFVKNSSLYCLSSENPKLHEWILHSP
jgi:hypothetical protein